MDVVQHESKREAAKDKLDLIDASIAQYGDSTGMLATQKALFTAQRNEADASYDSARAQAESDVRQLYLEAEELQQRHALALKQYEQATDLARLAKLRFENGLSTAIEMNAAHTGAMQAEASLVQARYNLILLKARLQLVKRGPLTTTGASKR